MPRRSSGTKTRHNITHQLLYRGEFEVPETTESQGTTVVRGKDVTRKLKRGGANVTYSNIPHWEAIDEYITNQLPAWTGTVHQPTPRTIDTGTVVQDSISDDFSPAAGEPFTVNANDELELLQTCFTQEGEDGSRSGASYFGLGNFSGGGSVRFSASGESVTWTFTPGYDIAAEDFSLYLRMRASDSPKLNATVNGTTWTIINDGVGGSLQWTDFANDPFTSSSAVGYDGGDFTAGTQYTVKIESTTAGSYFDLDVIAPLDNRFSYSFDDNNGGNDGYLNGPELYPIASIVSNEYSDTFNIIAATITTTVDDTSNQQALQASNDGGTTYLPNDGTEQNTATVTADFDAANSYGTTVRGKVTLSRYGSRTTATPQTGFNGQVMTSWQVEIDTNDLAVIDETTVTGSHYKNIQTLHRNSGRRFVVDHAEDTLPIESFKTGDVTKTADWSRLDHTRTTRDGDYANSVTGWGATDDQGNRLKAVAKDDDAIAQDGEEIEVEPLFKPEMDAAADLKSLVRTRLSEVLRNDDLVGSVDIVPKAIRPGYSYLVAELDGETLPLESVTFEIGVNGDRGALDFASDTDIVSALTGISTEVSSVKDAF